MEEPIHDDGLRRTGGQFFRCSCGAVCVSSGEDNKYWCFGCNRARQKYEAEPATQAEFEAYWN